MQILIVCGKNIRAKIVRDFEGRPQPSALRWPDNIYQVVADAAQSERQEIPATVCVQVDTLNRLEMQVFSTLAQVETVSVIAFSAFESRPSEKLDIARGEGAMIIDDLTELCQWVHRQNQGEIGRADAFLEEILADKTEESTSSEKEAVAVPKRPVEEPDTASPFKEKVSGDPGEPLLSDDELDALLGRKE